MTATNYFRFVINQIRDQPAAAASASTAPFRSSSTATAPSAAATTRTPTCGARTRFATIVDHFDFTSVNVLAVELFYGLFQFITSLEAHNTAAQVKMTMKALDNAYPSF
jgi:hypothetical protein